MNAEFAARFLESVFVSGKSPMRLSDNEIETVFRLIQLAKPPKMRRVLAQALSTVDQIRMLQHADTDQLVDFFDYQNDIPFLKPLFKDLDRDVQNEILKRVYGSSREKYDQLKPLAGDPPAKILRTPPPLSRRRVIRYQR